MDAPPTLGEILAGERTLTPLMEWCAKCRSLITDGKRFCGGCKVTIYCGVQCATDDREKHRLTCLDLRQSNAHASEQYKAMGYTKKSYHETSRNMAHWLSCIPGLSNEMDLKAWKHKAKSPLLWVHGTTEDRSGANITIEFYSRDVWEHSPDFPPMFGVADHKILLKASASQGYQSGFNYFCAFEVHGPDMVGAINTIFVRGYESFLGKADTLTAAFIVERLTLRVDQQDMRWAMDWMKEKFSGIDKETVELIANSSSTSRKDCNVMAYNILRALHLAYECRMVGLVAAAHLNGASGVVVKRHNERFEVRLESGKCLSVKPENFARVPGTFNRVTK